MLDWSTGLYQSLYGLRFVLAASLHLDSSHIFVLMQRSVELNPAQKDLVLKVAELLVSKEECDSRAEFWVEKAAKQLPGNPAVFNLKVRLPFL